MREFQSFGAFGKHLAECAVTEALALHEGLKLVAGKVEKTARDELGHYQKAAGAFPAWDPLTDATKADRERHGYTPDDPLLRSGAMRDSISHEVVSLEAIIGSTDPIAVYQELGTEHIPPRPFLGPAVVRNDEVIRKTIGAAAVSGMLGKEFLEKELGYEFEAGGE